MEKAVVITDPLTGGCFNLGGAEVMVFTDARSAENEVRSRLEDSETRLIFVNEEFLREFGPEVTDRVGKSTPPMVIPIPSERSEDRGRARRESIMKVVQRSIK